MAKRPIVEFLLQMINFIFTLCGLGVLFYGLSCLIKWKHAPTQPDHVDKTNYKMTNRLLLAIDPSKLLSNKLPTAWFIYLMITIGAVLSIISCFGYFSVFLVGLVLIELGVAAFMLIDHNWNKVITTDKSGNFQSVYLFLNKNWTIIRWVALVVIILEVVALVFALYLRSVITQAKYDDSSDDERLSTIVVEDQLLRGRITKPAAKNRLD
ncbi:hypothetical protein ACB092_11G257800 [Castanea dentata]